MHVVQSLADRFVLQRLAGSGGMGKVYRALDRKTGQPVAVKVLHALHGNDVIRFERETRILSELDHPLIVRHVSHGALPTGEPYLVMEWLDGEDLAARLGRGRLSVQDSLTLVTAVADALRVLHERGVVHRDLKPSNIFLVEGRIDRVKLLDLGLAQLEESTRVTAAGALVGTFAYMAPEQARGSVDLDARADTFALGCVLFECLTGQAAFSANHATAILTKILFEEAPRLSDKLAGAPPMLDALVARMLSKHPDDRPIDGRAAGEALRALLQMGLATDIDATVELLAPSALTGSEQRAVAVILLGVPMVAMAGQSGVVRARTVKVTELDTLGAVAEAHGGRIERMIDGSIAVVLSDTQVATDLGAQAARCALELSRYAPDRPITLAIGRGEPAQRLPLGPAIERAVRLLGHLGSPPLREPPAVVALDAASLGLLDPRFNVRDNSGVFVLQGEREVGEVRTLLGKRMPCFGRERELRTLKQLLDDCVDGGGAQAVLVTAPPGVGKSRLGGELLNQACGEDISTWIARGEPLRAGSAFSMLAGLVHNACGLHGGEPAGVKQERVISHVAERIGGSGAGRVAAFLGEIIGAPFAGDISPGLQTARRDAQTMHEQMRAAFLDLLAAECEARPVFIVLEDLHWGDLPTVRVIHRALRDLSEQPLFVLALARPEVHSVFPKLWLDRAVQEIRLRELSAKAAERMVLHALGERATPERVERIVALSEGNAFYLEELVRAAAEGQADLPDTLVSMVQSRLGGLNDEDRRILRAASVFGETFWAGGAAALLGIEPEQVDLIIKRLEMLVERELITGRKECRFPGEHEYAFRHALLREGAHAMLTEDDRALGHRLAGGWLEALGENDAMVLATHFARGNEPARAGEHYLRAVDHANMGGDTGTTIAHARQALECALPEDLRLAVLARLCAAYLYRPDALDTAAPYIDEVMRLSAPGSAPWFRAASVRMVRAMHLGHRDELLGTLNVVTQIDPAPDALVATAMALVNGIIILDAWGQLELAETLVQRLHSFVDPIAATDPMAQVWLTTIHAFRDAYAKEDPWSALCAGELHLELFHGPQYRRRIAAGWWFVGMNSWYLGHLERAERELGRVMLTDEELGGVHKSVSFAGVLLDRGALQEGYLLATRIVETAQGRHHRIDEGRGRWILAEALRRRGELDAAEREVMTAFDLLSGMALDHPMLGATLAALRLAQGRTAEALAAARQAMATYESTGACGFFRGAFVRLVHAECLHAEGDRTAACKAIAVARERIFRNCEKIADPEYRSSFLEGVPENHRTLEFARQWLRERA